MIVTDIKQIQELARQGFRDWESLGNVKAVRATWNAVLLSYTPAAQYDSTWTPYECMCRGLILNEKTGEVIARSFDKFFNWGEGGRKSAGHIVTITEKVDGSLGILYRDAAGGHHIATRGSFDSEQAEWATEHLWTYYDLRDLDDDLTLIFEIIYPGNRIVVDYGNREDLVLLAARNRHTGEYLPFFPDVVELANRYGFPTPRTFQFNNVVDIIAAAGALDATAEGWVVEFSDGQRFKFKGDRYLEIHRLVTNASFKRVLQAVAAGTYDAWTGCVPDEFLTQVKEWKAQIEHRAIEVMTLVEDAFGQAPKASRKEFALWAKERHPALMSYLFARLDGRDYMELVYRREFDETEIDT